jgi:hypothetical protein
LWSKIVGAEVFGDEWEEETMTPKPLTKEQRDTLDLLMPVIVRMDSIPFNIQTLIIDVVVAEQFWREAVKTGDYSSECPWCTLHLQIPEKTWIHALDCPWKLAQE